MSTQLEAITGNHPSRRFHLGFAQPLRPKIRRYFERKPGWIKSDIREMQRRLTDWEFLAKMGCSVPVWMRP